MTMSSGKTRATPLQPTGLSVVNAFSTHINRQMEKLLWGGGDAELAFLSTPLKPEAHGLQAGLPAGFLKRRG